MGKKRALSIGINYPGQPHRLRGCVNDSYMIEKLLRDQYGFEDIKLLLDNDATTDNMRSALNDLVDGAQPGDILFFHFSGHGSQLPDKAIDDDYEPDGLDEIICPVDLDWKTKVIRDDELKQIFDRVPNGVNLTVLLDCCNSGGGMDHLNQYQSLAPGERSYDLVPRNNDGRFLRPPQDIIEFAEKRKLQIKPRALSRNVQHTGLLISGCQSQQTSADALINGTYRGATTYYLNKVLSELGYDASYINIVDKLNKDIAKAGFTQRPELNGPQRLFEHSFLSDYSGTEFEADTIPNVVEQEVDSTPTPKKKKDDEGDGKNTAMVIAGVVALVAFVYFFIIN